MGRLVDTDEVMKRSKKAILKYRKLYPDGAIWSGYHLEAFVKKLLEVTPKPRIKQCKCKMRKRR